MFFSYEVLVYANHRLRKIMSGPNLAETKQSDRDLLLPLIKYIYGKSAKKTAIG